jgi:Uma2 family endonuclease
MKTVFGMFGYMRGLVEETGLAPVVLQTRPVIELDDDRLFDFCQLNRDFQIERSARGELIIMPPEGGSSGLGNSKLTQAFSNWAERDGTGEVFGPSTGFILPNGAMRAPDVSWVLSTRLEGLTRDEWKRFLPLCPDFVLELRSPSDAIRALEAKMQEYIENGARLGWLLDPARKRVMVYGPGRAVRILNETKSISGEPLLRGFSLDVERIWRAIERGKAARK